MTKKNSSTTYSSPQKAKQSSNGDCLFTLTSECSSVIYEEIEEDQGNKEAEQLIKNIKTEPSAKKRRPRVSQYHCPPTTTINLDLKQPKKRRKGRKNYQTIEPAYIQIDLYTNEVKDSKFKKEAPLKMSSTYTMSLKASIRKTEEDISSLNLNIEQRYQRVALLKELLQQEERVTADLNSKIADILMGSL